MSFNNISREKMLKIAGVTPKQIVEGKTYQDAGAMIRELLSQLAELESAMTNDEDKYAEQLANIITHFQESNVKTK